MKKLTLKVLAMLFVVAGMNLVFTSCDDDDDDDKPDPTPETGNVIVKENITKNTTWSKDKVYQLAGRIAVTPGNTLTIEPGTIIKGEYGTDANSTVLLITRGAKIMAKGTAEAPIIFTSTTDEIQPSDIAAGNFNSPNMIPTENGLWGGVVILGNAKVSTKPEAGGSEGQIEGIPASDSNGRYGGDNDADNSGEFTYVSIRHGGTLIGEGNELNGLTLGGVGNETVIDNVEIIGNKDDGIECFGGTVNIKNVVVWNAGDDALDTDQAFSGSFDNFVVITPGDKGFELDGPEGDYGSDTHHTLMNGIVKVSEGDVSAKKLMETRSDCRANIKNVLFTSIEGIVQISKKDDTYPSFENVYLDIPDDANLVDYFKNFDGIPEGVSRGTTNTVDISGFNWTWAHKAGKLNF